MPGEAIVTIRDKQWQVRVADTPWELMQGLGGLRELSSGTGTLFDTGALQTIEVTTVPMLFAIDIAFLSETAVVTEVYRNVEPGYIVTSTMPARYFLEVNADELADIDAGDRATVEFLPLEELPVITSDWMSALVGFMGFIVMGALMVGIVRDSTKSPQLLPQVVGKREIVYTVNLEAPKHVEEIVLEDAKVVLKRYGKTVVVFRPTEIQRRKIQQGKGQIHIFADQIEATIRPWRVREALYWPHTRNVTSETALPVFMKVAEWYVKHQRPMTVKELRPIATKYFKTEDELTQFYEYLASPKGQKEFRRELRAAMRRHGIPIPPEEEWLPLTMETEARFKPGEIVNYKGERVRVLEHIGDRVNIFIPSRQEEVWVKPEALQRIEGKQMAQREPTGTCYEDAWRFLIKEGEGELVHGTVQTIGKRITHAWVETETGYIWEPESGEFMKKAYFYERAKPRVEARYTAEEAAIMAARTKNLGPWTERERHQYLKKKSPAVIPTEPRRPRPRKDELEFLPDSPEVLAQTIDAIGYRERIDTAFQEAIRRAKGLK